MENISGKIISLKVQLDRLITASNELAAKGKHLESLTSNQENSMTRSDLRERIDLGIDGVFVEFEADVVQKIFFTWVNVCMMVVIIASAFLWWRLDQFEKKW